MKTQQQLETWMTTHAPLVFPKLYGAENTRLPSLVGIYWSMTDALIGFPPSQITYTNAVASTMPASMSEHVKARACRAYPSIVRQHHLIAILQVAFTRVIWSNEWDHAGIDVSIAYHGLSIGVASAVDTPRSHEWEQVKQRRHPDDGHTHLVRVYARQGEYTVGPFWLHDPARTVDEIKAFIEQLEAA